MFWLRIPLAPAYPAMVKQMAPVAPTEEVILNSSALAKKRPNAAVSWLFTWNNYPEDWEEQMAPRLQQKCFGYIIGQEGALADETPHLQGFLELKSKGRPIEYLGLPKQISWRAMGKNSSRLANVNYCSKEGKFIAWGTCKPKLSLELEASDVMSLEELPGWANELVGTVGGCLPPAEDRSIFWVWSSEGKMYKTETARHLAFHHDAVVIQGGRKHVLAVAFKNPAPIYMLLVPRSDEGFVSYASIELLKDSLYMSAFGTEATGMVNRKKPWVLVFANFPPDRSKLSVDRYQVVCVDPEPPDDMVLV